ncbi:MAG: hypothetical protein GY928_11355 [Colwellia sp.]|nr:hypothetical protein [Colwellia sp.]
MKALTLITALALSFNVQAEESKPQTQMEYCTTTAILVTAIMEARQAEIPLADLLGALDTKAFKMVAANAYSRPLWNTEKNKKREVSEYTNGFLSACLKRVK